ncbi:MAG: glycosyltransferase family 2 protein [Lachnospiraceae bacterium]|nr:glycosyltransferase family 2 protein [Lachnospiraceae bacterium]
MKITVVIPNYNGIKFMADCMDALAPQVNEDVQVLVVDNGSTDNSVSILEQSYPWAEVIKLGENTGFCHAVNVGIRQAESPYVILLNNDTKVLPGYIDALLDIMERPGNEKVFSASSQMLDMYHPELVDDAGDRYNALGWAFARGKGKPAVKYDTPAEIFAACGGASVYRKSVFEEIGYFDELHFAYLEDLDIGYRAKIYGYKNLYEPRAKVLHAGSGSSGSRYNAFKTNLSSANSVYVIWKNMPWLQRLINLPFLLLGFLVKTLFFVKKGMGSLYVRGCLKGFLRRFHKEARKNKVPFKWKHLGNYMGIQWQLWVNLLRRMWE